MTSRNSSHSSGSPIDLLALGVPATVVRSIAVAQASEGTQVEGQLVGSQREVARRRRPTASAAERPLWVDVRQVTTTCDSSHVDAVSPRCNVMQSVKVLRGICWLTWSMRCRMWRRGWECSCGRGDFGQCV